MKYTYKKILMAVLVAITIYGLVTEKYLFMVFLIPLSFDFFNKKDTD